MTGLVIAEVALLVARRDGNAEPAVGRGVAIDAGDLGCHAVAVLYRIVNHSLDAKTCNHIRIIKRSCRLDINRGAHTAAWQSSLAGFIDIDRRNRFRRQVGKIEGPFGTLLIVLDGSAGHLPTV